MRNTLFIFFILLATAVHAQDRIRSLAPRVTATEAQQTVADRAIGVINAGNFGHTITNYARFYASPALGPRAEYPIGSGTRYIQDWGLIIGMPGKNGAKPQAINSIFSRTGLNFLPETGYHNRDSVRIANSSLPFTWPKTTGWPVRDQQGNPLFVSNQDLYMVYGDSSNNPVHNLKVEQTNYAFSAEKYQDIIYFKFRITNRSNAVYDSVWVGHYIDVDVGNLPDGDPEYADDIINVDHQTQTLFFFDDGKSIETRDSTTSFVGLSVISTTPTNEGKTGLTDWHYLLYDDFFDDDQMIFNVLSSSPVLYNSADGSRYFHLAPDASSIRMDDETTIPSTGLDITAIMGTGPYTLAPGESIELTYALIGGRTRAQLLTSAAYARSLAAKNFNTPLPPDVPALSGFAGDGKNTLLWTDETESVPDRNTGRYDFQGYKLYRSVDLGKTWSVLGTFDRVDGIGPDSGIPYRFTDTNVSNGFWYHYALTAFDTDPDLAVDGEDVLESSRGTDPASDKQQVVLTPQAPPAGQVSGSLASFNQTTGSSQSLLVTPTSKPLSAPADYTVVITAGYKWTAGTYAGTPLISVDNQAAFLADSAFVVEWTGSNELTLRSGKVSSLDVKNYTPGQPVTLAGIFSLQLPVAGKTGDRLRVGPAVTVTSGPVTVLPTTLIVPARTLITSDGNQLLFSGGTQVNEQWIFTVGAASTDEGNLRAALKSIRVVPNPYVISNLFEPAYDKTLYSEPFRAIRFVNLPGEATIHIFTLDGTRVTTLHHDSGTSTYSWNLQNESRREIAPGIYLYQVRTRVGEIVGKFAVIK
ncbi:MAG: hypothetical protein HUU10_13115 [Bacteroidetes bacterium]|nr:hypothetical protein [Bacteroidota bacterium]